MLEERMRIIHLLDVYGPLLTEHQRKIMEDYYLEDLSLGEIAENGGTSRQAVHDVIKRVVRSLETYEEKLHLMERLRYISKMTAGAIENISTGNTVRIEYGLNLLRKLQSELEKE